jgi:predicted phage baseplate assembly protein
MPLPLPVLDDRGYQELIDGMRERLPRTAPRWTDHNVSDPGITLLELFAYLGDSLLYRLDRVPERHYRAFLRLLGCAPRRARCAQVPVSFATGTAAAPRDLPAGAQVCAAGGAVVFETGAALHVSDARIAVVLTASGDRWVDRTAADAGFAAPYAALGTAPRPGDALYLGFDRAPGPDAALLRLWVAGEDFAADAASWSALREEWRRGIPRRSACRRVGGAARRFWEHYGARVSWEFFDGTEWRTLPALKDRTRALTLCGPVRWRHSAAHQPGGVAGHDTKYFIRCRVIDGEYDCPPLLRGVRMNAVMARHSAVATGPVTPLRSTGAAAQRYQLPRTPVVPGSVRLTLTNDAGAVESDWIERQDFDRSGPHARQFVLDAVSGDISFGDGSSGAVPEAGAKPQVTWKVGGGIAGNVPAGTLVAARGAADGLAVQQLAAGWGGADTELLEAAKARAFDQTTAQRCAATLADFERLALAAPALPVAKAFAVAGRPDMECLPAAGCVTVVVVPRCVDLRPGPSAALCRAVAGYLEPRRPLALEVHVAGPRYTQVRVTATLALKPGFERAPVLAAANQALRGFLHPLHGGPAGGGWAVGRAVYRSEILAELDAIAGVHHVARLALTAGDGTAALCGDVAVCASGLVISGEHVLTAIDGAQ